MITALPLAHGIGGVRDLPIPLWLFYYAGAIVLVVSFVLLGVLWTKPRLEGKWEGRAVRAGLRRVLLCRALRAVLGGLSFGLLVVVFLAAAVGEPAQGANIAPTFVFVIFWLGLVPLVVLLGNVWSVLNPWRAAADGLAWATERARVRWEPLADYPAGLGRWPAAVLLFLFAAYELAYTSPADPRALALAIFLYSWLTWVGAAVYGREAWFSNGDGFSVYFELLSRIAPYAARLRGGRRELVVRPPLSALALRDPRPGTLAFVAVMLGSVAFDGFSRTTFWQDRRYDLESPLIVDSPGLADLVASLFNLGGLVGVILVVAGAFLLAVAGARLAAHAEERLSDAFVGSLIPIALAYAVAHYFSLFVIQGQFVIPLASDPFGWGWDVFATKDFEPNIGLLSANLVWYVQVATLITGHVAGLVVAHDRAVALFESPRTAVRTQYALLALMVVYTVGGLWVLSAG